ncbi:MAG: hypothetical protein ACE5IR_27110, partial [bacterium]
MYITNETNDGWYWEFNGWRTHNIRGVLFAFGRTFHDQNNGTFDPTDVDGFKACIQYQYLAFHFSPFIDCSVVSERKLFKMLKHPSPGA